MDQLNHLSLSVLGFNRQQVTRLMEQKDERIKNLEDQLKTIQDKLGYYMGLEEALKAGIVDARMTGTTIVNESKEEAEKLLTQTNEQVTQYKEEFAYQSRELINSGSVLRDRFNEMKQDMQTILNQYQELIEETDFDALYPGDQVERLTHQTDHYEADDIFNLRSGGNRKLWQDNTLNEEEKKELEKLIHEVISNEAKDEENETSQEKANDSKLVNFAMAKSK
ncbi:hypothetical protein [Vaginisenegalia massiliensis]|uniref:hypothetical protein n=1 Tax=Vaginisenegalia massiliensis TaxID=2058294 RepID=UPI000F5394DD|nr:hypothetical protein [Vaginisenegalia massiliensis]